MIYTVTFNPSIDYIVRMDTEVRIGMTNRSSSEDYFIGGKGNNVSFVLKELGIDSVALGFAGGFTGDAIVKGLTERGISSDYVILKDGISRINIKMKGIDGETEINGNGPDIPTEALNKLFKKLDNLTKGDTIVLAGSIPKSLPVSIYEDILERTSKKGVLAVVDASGELLKKVLKYHPFLIKPNKQELSEIFNREITGRSDIDECAMELKNMGALNVIVSLGADGAILYTENGEVFVSPSPEGKVKNSVGAGDSMVAGFLAGLSKFSDMRKALKLGTAAGAATAFSDDLAVFADIDRIYSSI